MKLQYRLVHYYTQYSITYRSTAQYIILCYIRAQYIIAWRIVVQERIWSEPAGGSDELLAQHSILQYILLYYYLLVYEYSIAVGLLVQCSCRSTSITYIYIYIYTCIANSSQFSIFQSRRRGCGGSSTSSRRSRRAWQPWSSGISRIRFSPFLRIILRFFDNCMV